MPVFRVDKSRDFTVVANCVFKDRSLSAKAKGILVEMLSLPESWDYTLKGLTSLFSDGIDSIRQGINELEKHGYIVRERKRDSRGRLGGMEYVIYETPHKPVENSIDSAYPKSQDPTTENPTQDSSAEEMPTVYKELNKYNKKPSGIIQGAFFIFSMYIKEVKRKITKTILIQLEYLNKQVVTSYLYL